MKLNSLEFALVNNSLRAWSQRALETPLMIGARGALRGLRVLEVGCGRGVGVEILLEQLGAAQVAAFDLDPKMVALAQKRVARFGQRARVFVGDAEHIDAPDASFDAVVEFGILHHVPNWRQALSEIARVLRPGGVFYFEDLLKGSVGAPVARNLFDHPQASQFSGDEFRTALASAGLQLDENWRQVGQIGLMGRATRVQNAALSRSDSAGFHLPMRIHSWYGVNAVVRGAGGMECDLVVEGKAFPHPSLVNAFIRRALPRDERFYLGVWHEVGHLQALPFVIPFALTLIAVILRRPRPLLPKLIAALLGTQAVWELASETYVVTKTRKDYRRAYPRLNPNLVAFWSGMSALAVLSSAIILRRSAATGAGRAANGTTRPKETH